MEDLAAQKEARLSTPNATPKFDARNFKTQLDEFDAQREDVSPTNRRREDIVAAEPAKKAAAPKRKTNAVTEEKKKSGIRKQGNTDTPPTPTGCEWRASEGGWNLWRTWSEKDETNGKRIKKGRYAGYLSQNAWQVMKEYDYETFISLIAEQVRRHGGR